MNYLVVCMMFVLSLLKRLAIMEIGLGWFMLVSTGLAGLFSRLVELFEWE